MALLDWENLSWEGFVAGVQGYRDHFSPRDREDHAYFRSLDVVQAHPLAERSDYAGEIVHLLNTWACRLSSERAPGALNEWMRDHAVDLETVEVLTIVDPNIPYHTAKLGNLHDDLIRHMRTNGVPNMSDAAASKTLHVVLPDLFVMWDKEIRRSAPEGYGAYLGEMHALAGRLTEQAPADDVEAHLQELLGYETRKTLAKYLDEYNWFEAVGRDQLAARSYK
jgi:hypothetical protein